MCKTLLKCSLLAVGLNACSDETQTDHRSSSRAKIASSPASHDANQGTDDRAQQDPQEQSLPESSQEHLQPEEDDKTNHNNSADHKQAAESEKPAKEKVAESIDKSKTEEPSQPREGQAAVSTVSCNAQAGDHLIDVGTDTELRAALGEAKPGDVIKLKDGVYKGNFKALVSASATKPITLCGSDKAILDGANLKTGMVLHLATASYWRLLGFTVRGGQKGIMLDESDYVLIDAVTVHNIGLEAVHFRNNSSYNTIQNSRIFDTGKYKPQYGEGVYIGTAKSNGAGDKSDFNNVLGNTFGPGIAAEHIDAKEWSSGGLIEGNTFDGTGQTGANSSESIIYIKGNDYVVRSNFLKNPFLKGIRVWDVVKDDSGDRNLIENNTIEDVKDLGVSIEGGNGNIVKCNNIYKNVSQPTNVACSL